MEPLQFAKNMECLGAGELIIQSVDRDGTYEGLDEKLLFEISQELSIPTIGIGGLSSLDEIKKLHKVLNMNGYGAGSLFVFQGNNRGVLINYPSSAELERIF